MKIKILIFTFNRPDILSKQINSLKKYLKNEHEIIIVHDSRDNEFVHEFEELCSSLNLQYYHHPSFVGKTPSEYHSESIQWAYDNLISEDDVIFLLDHDMFLIEELNIVDYLKDYDIVGCKQNRKNINYIWPGLMIFKYKSIKDIIFNFHPCSVSGQFLDTGGGTYKILESKNIRFKDSQVCYPDSYNDINLLDESVHQGYPFELHLDNKFLHSRNACSWHNGMNISDASKLKTLNTILKNFIDCDG